jgi:hypothetical protein
MEFAARNMKIKLPADHTVGAEIDLGPEGGAFSLAACRGWSARRRSALPLFASTVTSPSKRRWSEGRFDESRQ